MLPFPLKIPQNVEIELGLHVLMKVKDTYFYWKFAFTVFSLLY